VAGRDNRVVPGAEPIFFAVVHGDLHSSGQDITHVGGLPAIRLGDRLDVFGPLRAGFKNHPADGVGLNVERVDFSLPFLKRTRFFGFVQTLEGKARSR
jgi:hypothetical protein